MKTPFLFVIPVFIPVLMVLSILHLRPVEVQAAQSTREIHTWRTDIVTTLPQTGSKPYYSYDVSSTDIEINPSRLIADRSAIANSFSASVTKTVFDIWKGNGDISIIPENKFYNFDGNVTLAAIPDPSWYFSSCHSDLVDTINPAVVNMNNDKFIRANIDSGQSLFTSDDFNACGLNDTLWTFFDPDGDTSLQMNGAQAIISLPSGTTHDTWGTITTTFSNNVPRIRQFVSDSDFELEIKFDNDLSLRWQMEGVLVEQDDNNMLRFEFHHDGSNLRIFAASFAEGVANTKYNEKITNTSPIYMRIHRQGDEWTQSYSDDDINWTNMISFTHPITVNSVSPFAGNGEVANTVMIDYVFETLTPIIPEDGNSPTTSLTVTTTGSGSVDVNPNQASYCGDEVELTASAVPGWIFAEWNGDLSGNLNPASVIMDANKVITATFDVVTFTHTLSTTVLGNGLIEIVPDKQSYLFGEIVTLTATADVGWIFTEWGGDLSGNLNPAVLIMNSDKSIIANFSQGDTMGIFLPLLLNYAKVGLTNKSLFLP